MLRLGRETPVEELLDRGHPVTHHHLDRGGQRNGAAGVDDHLDLGVVEGGAVDVGGVGAEQPGLTHLLDLALLAVGPHADVGGDPRPGLPGQLPVVAGHLEVGELRARVPPGPG